MIVDCELLMVAELNMGWGYIYLVGSGYGKKISDLLYPLDLLSIILFLFPPSRLISLVPVAIVHPRLHL